VAHHVAAGHYGILDWAKMIVAGEALPELTMDDIDQMNAKHAKEHVNCTKSDFDLVKDGVYRLIYR